MWCVRHPFYVQWWRHWRLLPGHVNIKRMMNWWIIVIHKRVIVEKYWCQREKQIPFSQRPKYWRPKFSLPTAQARFKSFSDVIAFLKLPVKQKINNPAINTKSMMVDWDIWEYRKVASSRPVYYLILDHFVQSINASKFHFINSLKMWKCATNRDSLLLATLR